MAATAAAVVESEESHTLTLLFPGLSGVHVDVREPDGLPESASGRRVMVRTYQSGSTSFEVAPGTYDVRVIQGAAEHVIDNVDCGDGDVTLDEFTATLALDFPGLSGVHSYVHVADDTAGEASGSQVTRATWRRDRAEMTVLRQRFDVRVVKGASVQVRDNIDCTSGECAVDGLSSTLTVNFPGLSSVHTKVCLSDGVTGTATGQKVTHANWKSNQAVITVPTGVYDLEIRKGGATMVVDDVVCSEHGSSVDDLTARLLVRFPGLSGVHTDVRVVDDVAGTASGNKMTHANWRSGEAEITVLRQHYDLRIRKGAATYVVDDLDCTGGACVADDLTAQMTVNFPGLTSVHTDVRVPDGVAGAASGGKVTHSNWKTDSTTIPVLRQFYDLRIRKGSSTQYIDDVDCTSGDCEVGGALATLTVRFPGLSGVHTSVRAADGIPGSASGDEVTHANWKTNEAVITIPSGVYDLQIRKGASTFIVDDVRCSGGECVVDNITASLTVLFPGLSGVHTAVVTPDGVPGTASNLEVTHANWKNNQAEITVLRESYDLRIRVGGNEIIIDDVDCTSGTCVVDGLATTLTVNFPGLTGVHTAVLTPDAVDGTATGAEVTHANWKNDRAEITVPPGVYDLKIRKGSATFVVDNIDCTNGVCVVDDITARMVVKFPGMSGVHTAVMAPDNVAGTVSDSEITSANWRNEETEIVVFRQSYDLKIRKGGATHIVDDVNCVTGDCVVEGITASVNVQFPGLSGVHTALLIPDGETGSAGGNEVTHGNWKTDEVALTAFAQSYDIKIRKGDASLILDDVDCTSGTCVVDDITATLTVNFEGMSGVHTAVMVPDGADGTISDDEMTHANWKTNQAVVTVFRQPYDLRIRKGGAEHIVDEVDCTSGTCVVDNITANMTVNFPGMNGVHTAVHATDDNDGTADGDKVTDSNWKTDQTTITVFPQVFDLKIRKGDATHIVDDVDCTDGDCVVDGIAATLTVNFPGLSSVHTAAFVPDGVDGDISEEDKVTHANWKNDQAVMKVFPQSYDLQLRKEGASLIVDNVDCSSGTCTVEDITAVLSVAFPGLSSVHTTVKTDDEVVGTATGEKVTHANWKTHEADLTVFRQTYDVEVRHSETTVIDSVDCSSGTCSVVILGNAQVTLVDGDNNVPLTNIDVKAYEKLPNGTISYVTRGKTNPDGLIHFTLPDVGTDKIYVLKVHNPFGNGKSYYSPLLTATGPFEFRITREGEYPLDLVPPAVEIVLPVDGHGVSIEGFEISGFATDNNEIESVTLTVDDPAKGRTTLEAEYESAGDSWTATITAAMISENPGILLTATARDRAQNEAVDSIVVIGILDTTGPEIRINSHAPNADVPVTGFLLSGTVNDETTVDAMTVTLRDSALGITIDNQPLAFAGDTGAWTVVVSNGLITEGAGIVIDLTATDEVGNAGATSIVLNVVAVDNTGRHMINRITFGATPQLLDDVEFSGALAFLDDQINHETIDDSEFEALLGDFLPETREELKIYAMLHMIYSKRQLREVMAWFWENHFNTTVNKPGNKVIYELAEHQQFRGEALGNFRTLLETSAKSPAMLYFLDTVQSSAADANENYARELLELHTMGVDGGYTSADIEAAAEIFTGWTVQNDMFFFDMTDHNPDAQTFLGELIPAGGVEQGEQLLDIVVAHRSTAEFVCKKLVQVFVDDVPPESLVSRVADTFQLNLNADDQLALVVREILTSPEFSQSYRSKIKSPVEHVAAFARNLNVGGDGDNLHIAVSTLGMNLFEYPVPTGFSEVGEDWINSNLILERIKLVNQTAINNDSNDDTYIEPVAFFQNNGFETAEGIVGYLLNLAFGDDFTELDSDTALDVLNTGEEFSLNAPDADQKLRQLVGLVLSYPGYQYQ